MQDELEDATTRCCGLFPSAPTERKKIRNFEAVSVSAVSVPAPSLIAPDLKLKSKEKAKENSPDQDHEMTDQDLFQNTTIAFKDP